MRDNQNCLRCGLPKDDCRHDRVNFPPDEGWHSFRGVEYLRALEDALLFVREKSQPHRWRETGITIDTADSFSEKRCAICGAINWGGKEDGVCFGNVKAEAALNEAHNRRAFAQTAASEIQPVGGSIG